jgi:hypothetical protein
MQTNIRRLVRSVAMLALVTSAACAYNPPPSTRVVYIERRPPAARVEVIGVRPGPGYVWVAGYWGWSGADYYWVPGRWVIPPQRVYTAWVPGRWDHHRGRGWYYRPGHWRR